MMYRKSICITLGVVAALTSFAMTDFSSVAKENASIGDAVVKVVNPKEALCEEELSQDDIAGYVSCEQNYLLPEKKTTSLRIQELDDEENPEEEPVEEPEDKLIASGTMGNGFSWEIKNDVLTVQGLGEMPAMEEEGSPWISYSNQINAIVIGEGVKTISAKSFMGLDHATQLTVLGDVTKVGDFAFCQCRKLEKAEFTSALKEVGYAAFAECEALVDFSADSLLKVGEFAFQQVALTEFVISKDLEELPNNCFTASELRSYVVEAGNPQYQAIDGVLYSKDGKTLLAFPCYGEGNITEASYRVEDGCNAIDAYAFMHNRTIENIDFNEVTTLGEAAFLDSFLTGALSIPDCITVLDGKFTFNASKRITSVHFGSGLKATVYSMFEDCTGIEDIDFGNTLTDLAMRTFKGCNSLTEITLPDRMTKWDGSVFNSCENLVTFRSKNLQEITYADFAQDYKLENVILGNVKMIYRQAFTNCPSLVRIDLPKTVTFVDENL